MTRSWRASAQPLSVGSPPEATNNYGLSPERQAVSCGHLSGAPNLVGASPSGRVPISMRGLGGAVHPDGSRLSWPDWRRRRWVGNGGVAGAMVLGALLKPNGGVGSQRGMTHAELVHDDGRLINADHITAGRASKMQPHLTSVGPASRVHKRETPQRRPLQTTVGESRGPSAWPPRTDSRALSYAE
jgi:hypothetical protein